LRNTHVNTLTPSSFAALACLAILAAHLLHQLLLPPLSFFLLWAKDADTSVCANHSTMRHMNVMPAKKLAPFTHSSLAPTVATAAAEVVPLSSSSSSCC